MKKSMLVLALGISATLSYTMSEEDARMQSFKRYDMFQRCLGATKRDCQEAFAKGDSERAGELDAKMTAMREQGPDKWFAANYGVQPQSSSSNGCSVQ